MDTPLYESDVIIGGQEQTTLFQALPKPQRTANNGIITRQSGKLILTFKDAAGDPFDASSLAGTDAKAVPFGSDVTPVTLGVGVISGASNEIYTVEWVRDTIPSSWSTFAQDQDGAIVLYVELEETGVADYFQTYTRFNVTDGDFKGDATNLPLVVFDYTWDDAIASEWAQFNRGTPLNLTDAAAYLAGKRNTDWGAVADKDLTTSPVGVDNEQHIIAGIGGDWSGFTIGDIVRYSLTDLVWYARTGADGDEVYVIDEAARYRSDGAGAWNIVAGTGDMTVATYDAAAVSEQLVGLTATQSMTGKTVNGVVLDAIGLSTEYLDGTGAYSVPAGGGGGSGDVVGPGSSVDDNIATFDLTTGKLIQDSGINISAVTANTAKVTNANHTGDATGATALTLATVNSNVGSFTNADVTVNAKGLVTAVSNGSGGSSLDIPNTLSTGTTSYTMVLTDAGKTIWNPSTADSDIEIPLNASVAFVDNTVIMIMNISAAVKTVTAVAGVTLNDVDGNELTISTIHQGLTLVYRGSDVWEASGDIEESTGGGGGILPGAVNSVKTADYTILAADITAGVVLELGSATVADRVFTLDVALLDITTKINFKNTSDFRLQIVVSNTGTMTLNDNKLDIFLWSGDGILTLNGETATNANTIAGF